MPIRTTYLPPPEVGLIYVSEGTFNAARPTLLTAQEFYAEGGPDVVPVADLDVIEHVRLGRVCYAYQTLRPSEWYQEFGNGFRGTGCRYVWALDHDQVRVYDARTRADWAVPEPVYVGVPSVGDDDDEEPCECLNCSPPEEEPIPDTERDPVTRFDDRDLL